MAILLVRIENTASLPLNEFYDYNGHVYALTRSRGAADEKCLDPEDFYEASIGVTSISDTPIVFLTSREGKLVVCGWYRTSHVYVKSSCPAFFLEGNVIAASSDAVLLPQNHYEKVEGKTAITALRPVIEAEAELNKTGWLLGSLFYEVVEEEDFRFPYLKHMIDDYRGSNAFLRYPYLNVTLDPAARRSYAVCIDHCRRLAEAIMTDHCPDIRQIKELESYSRIAVSLNSKDADGFYYLAMASYQLGFHRQGMKAIEKALRLEGDSADLLAQKAYLLASMGHLPEACEAFHRAYLLSDEEDYLLWEGKTCLLAGKIDEGYDAFRKITDSSLLSAAGIDTQDMERKWPFINFRGFHFKNIFRK